MDNTNTLTIASVMDQKNKYNLALPFTESRQMNPWYRLNVSLVSVNLSGDASEYFKVGSRKIQGGGYEDLFSLTKPFLQRLATEAGIQFAPGAGDVIKLDENTWKASAFGALRLPDGNVRTSSNFKVIDLVTEERKYRIAYAEKAYNGITEERAAKDAAKKYAGEWRDGGFHVAERDRERYVATSLLDAMAQLRSNAPQKAATGAILRVIRDLLGIKGTYTMAELKKPFAVARMAFSPDYNDPMVKQMMLQQCISSVGNIFGNTTPVTQTISISRTPDMDEEADTVDADVVPEPEKAARPRAEPEAGTEPPREVFTEEQRDMDFCCDRCGKQIPEKVWDYSLEHYGRPLCYDCQRAERKAGGRR